MITIKNLNIKRNTFINKTNILLYYNTYKYIKKTIKLNFIKFNYKNNIIFSNLLKIFKNKIYNKIYIKTKFKNIFLYVNSKSTNLMYDFNSIK